MEDPVAVRKHKEEKSTNCSFDPKTGIKTYDCPDKCTYAFTAQYKAYVLGAAPKPIRRIDNYSYQTELADTTFFMENLLPGVFYNKLFPDLHRKLVPVFKDSPNKNGPDGVDMARHNLGLYKGRVVMIDFY